MTTSELILCGFLVLFLCTNICFIIKYYNLSNALLSRAKKYVDKLYVYHNRVKNELEQKKATLDIKEKAIGIEYDKIKDTFDKKYNALVKDYKIKEKEKDKELDEAVKESEEELKKSVEKIDQLIGEKIADLTLKNTLTFDCVCGKKDIPCFIDLTKENTFRCDSCNSVYAIQAKFSPVIVGRASSEEEFARIVEERMQEESNETEF